MLPAAHNHFRWGTQTRKLYDGLSCGPLTASEIVRDLHIYHYQQKLSEIRKKLNGTGVTVKARPLNGPKNHWEYRLATEQDQQKPPQ